MATQLRWRLKKSAATCELLLLFGVDGLRQALRAGAGHGCADSSDGISGRQPQADFGGDTARGVWGDPAARARRRHLGPGRGGGTGDSAHGSSADGAAAAEPGGAGSREATARSNGAALAGHAAAWGGGGGARHVSGN